MNPNIEFFLEDALSSIQPTSRTIGRVVVEPDYESQPDPADASHIASQLTECLASQSLAGKTRDLEIDKKYSVLAKYIRRISIHADEVEGPWIEIAPPGNWI